MGQLCHLSRPYTERRRYVILFWEIVGKRARHYYFSAGRFIGSSLQGLKSPWMPSRIDPATGAAQNMAVIGGENKNDLALHDTPEERSGWLERFEFWVEADEKIHSAKA